MATTTESEIVAVPAVPAAAYSSPSSIKSSRTLDGTPRPASSLDHSACAQSVSDSARIEQFELDIGAEGEADARELPPVDRGRGAWGFVAAAFLLETFLYGFSYSYATILVYFETHDPWQKDSIAALSAVGTTALALQFLFPTFAVLAFRRYPEAVKPSLWVSMVASCGAMLLSSWATKVWQLIVLQGVICGSANAVLFAPVWLYLSEWWVARRGLAFGIVLSGIGFGGFAFPFLLNALLETGGFPWLCRAWALIMVVVLATAIMLIKPRIPRPKPAKGQRGPWLAVDRSFVRDPVFILMCLASLLAALSYLPVALLLPVYASGFTSSTTQQNLILAIFNLFAALGAALSGRVSDYSYSLTVIGCGVCGALVSLTAWGLADNLGKTYAFAVLFALTGQSVSSWGGAARDVAKQNPNTSTLVLCLFSVVRGVGSIVMPFVSETLYNPDDLGKENAWGSNGFEKMIVSVGITSALSALAGLGLGWCNRRKKAE
ncbi:hypothetical protein JCM10450v2_006987 [Rhodotorula kratochvilovae]